MKINLAAILEHVSDHWLRYATIAITGLLTWNAAWELTGNPVYCFILVALAEGATLYWLHAIERVGGVGWEKKSGDWQFDIAVITQFVSAGTGIVVAWTAIIATDIASLTFIAKNNQLDIFTAFQTVPVWAQSIVVYVIPVLAVSHGLLATFYHIASPEASAGRRIRRAYTRANVARSEAHASEYERLADDKARAVGRAKAGSDVNDHFREHQPAYKGNGNHGEPEKTVFTNPPRQQ